MKGDYSRARFRRTRKFSGILHQQGKVLLDRDWNEQVDITVDWQDQTARDVFGSGIAAIPEKEFDGFRIRENSVLIEPERICFELTSGRLWADGFPLFIEQANTKVYVAPLQGIAEEIEKSTHYVIVLEIWREAISAYQMPDILLEPALEGIDTTQRLQTSFDFRFFEVADSDIACHDIKEVLDAHASQERIRLTVEIPERFAGFENRLYRIEIADLTKQHNDKMFKWSRSNASLGGRGIFDSTREQIKITANLQSIITSGSKDFYLEVIEKRDTLGNWMPTFGANAVLLENGILEIAEIYLDRGHGLNEESEDVFFLLWDGIKAIDEYEESAHLDAGIFIKFEQTNSLIRAGDYWVFPIRPKRDDLPLPTELLPKSVKPHGIEYSLVPYAIISNDGTVTDCREPFQPLTETTKCCESKSCKNLKLLGIWAFIIVAAILWTYSIVQLTLTGLIQAGIAIILLASTLSFAGWIFTKIPDLISS